MKKILTRLILNSPTPKRVARKTFLSNSKREKKCTKNKYGDNRNHSCSQQVIKQAGMRLSHILIYMKVHCENRSEMLPNNVMAT